MRAAVLLPILTFICALPCPADEPIGAEQVAATLESVFECVLDHHIDPPTRQQMVLALVRHLHQQDSAAVRAELSRTVSELGSKDQLYQFMRTEIERNHAPLLTAPESLNRWDLDWLSSTVPGGIQLEEPKDVDVEQQLAANRYVGIGVQLSKRVNDFVFDLVMENGTAARGGILSGDQLLRINSIPVDGDMQHVVDQLRGPEGSAFQVTVRTGADEPRDIELRRQVVVMKTIKLEPLKPEDTSAVIVVEDIRASSVHELQNVIEQLPDAIDEVQLKLEFDGNFHYFCLFADALLDAGRLGRVVTREGSRVIRTSDGNVLAGRRLKIELIDRREQQQLLRCLALRADAHVSDDPNRPIRPVYLLEPLKIMDRPRGFDAGHPSLRNGKCRMSSHTDWNYFLSPIFCSIGDLTKNCMTKMNTCGIET